MSTPIISWPSSVPPCIMPMSAQGGLRDNRYSFETDSKMPPVERPASSWTPEIYQLDLSPISVAQFDAFQDWYRGELRFGVMPFRFAHPITGADGVWKIVKGEPPYQVRRLLHLPKNSPRRCISLSFSLMSWPEER